MVSTMNINACKVITRIWKIDQASANINCAEPKVTVLTSDDDAAFKVNKAIKIKINSPAYKLPNKRSANEIGLAIKPTNSSNRLKGINAGWLKGCNVSSLINPLGPLILML